MDCSEYELKEYKDFVNLDEIQEDGFYTMTVGYIPEEEFIRREEFDESKEKMSYENRLGQLVRNGISEDLKGLELLTELSFKDSRVIRDNERYYIEFEKTGKRIEVDPPFYNNLGEEMRGEKNMYMVTVVQEFVPHSDNLERADLQKLKNMLFAGYRDSPFTNSYQAEHEGSDNN